MPKSTDFAAAGGIFNLPLDALPYRPGEYYSNAIPGYVIGGSTPSSVSRSQISGNGKTAVAPLALFNDIRIDRLGVYVMGGPGYTGQMKIAVYGLDGTLIADLGVIAISTGGACEVTCDLPLPKGIYFVAMKWDGAVSGGNNNSYVDLAGITCIYPLGNSYLAGRGALHHLYGVNVQGETTVKCNIAGLAYAAAMPGTLPAPNENQILSALFFRIKP